MSARLPELVDHVLYFDERCDDKLYFRASQFKILEQAIQRGPVQRATHQPPDLQRCRVGFVQRYVRDTLYFYFPLALVVPATEFFAFSSRILKNSCVALMTLSAIA